MPERLPPEDPREWLNRARSNVLLAQAQREGIYLEDLCFNAQQAVENAIKAVFLQHGLKFPHIHDLAQLLTLLEKAGVKIPKFVRKGEELTRFAVEARYPGMSGPTTRREHGKAVRTAEAILRWCQRKIP